MSSRMPVLLAWERQDRNRRLPVLAAAGLALGTVMAVLGLPPIDLHGPLHHMGIMDPLCGGTRSVHSAMRGDLAESWRYNPVGPVLVIGAVGVLLRQAAGLATGRWLNLRIADRRTFWWITVLALAVLEYRQQSLATLLSGSPGPPPFVGVVIWAAVAGAVLLAVRWPGRRQRSRAEGR